MLYSWETEDLAAWYVTTLRPEKICAKQADKKAKGSSVQYNQIQCLHNNCWRYFCALTCRNNNGFIIQSDKCNQTACLRIDCLITETKYWKKVKHFPWHSVLDLVRESSGNCIPYKYEFETYQAGSNLRMKLRLLCCTDTLRKTYWNMYLYHCYNI